MTLKGHGNFWGKVTTHFQFRPGKVCEFCSSEPQGQSFKFEGIGFSKTYTGPAKNCGRGFILCHWSVMPSLGENWLLVSYSAKKKICQFHSKEPEGWNFKFDGTGFSKTYTGWPKNWRISLIWWHWKVMVSLGENFLLVSYSAKKKICQFHFRERQGRNFKFDGMVFSNSYIGWAKNYGMSFMLWHWKAMESFGEKWLQVSNSVQEKFCQFRSSEPEGSNLKFHGMLFSKGYTGSARNFGRSFIWWHWIVRTSLGENWLLVSYSAQKKYANFVHSEPEGQKFKFDCMVFS